MKLSSILAAIIIAFTLSGCAATHRQPLSAPISTPAPVHDTSSLESNIKDLEKALDKASSQIGRIRILIDSIPDN
jgi:PBP1b-binding outer membrane lipoprotein LpoB